MSNAKFRLRAAGLEGAIRYLEEYTEVFQSEDIKTWGGGGGVGRLSISSQENMQHYIKASLLYHRKLEIEFRGNDEAQFVKILSPEEFKSIIPGLVRVEVPHLSGNEAKEFQELAFSGKIGYGFNLVGGKFYEKVYSDLSELVARDRVLIRPVRALLGFSSGPMEAKAITPAGAFTDVWTPLPPVVPPNERSASDLVAKRFSGSTIAELGREIIIPYISDISLYDFALVLDDEADLITEFRLAIDALIENAAELDLNLNEFVSDVVEPRISAIERRFKQIVGTSRLRLLGAGVPAMALTLSAFASGGLSAALLAIGGAGGFGAAMKEFSNRKERIDVLKDDPLYLLWKMKRRASHP